MALLDPSRTEIVYSVMAEPLAADAVQVKITCESDIEPERAVGAEGTAAGMTREEGEEALPAPIAVIDVTVNM